MKKYLSILLAAGIALSSVSTVTYAQGASVNSKKMEQQLKYSNLVDYSTQKQVMSDLKAAGVSYAARKNVLSHINAFNHAVGNVSLVNKGYRTIKGYQPHYNEDAMADRWEKAYPGQLGINCRLTSFTLMKDFINVKHTKHADLDTLAFDQHVIKTSPDHFFNKQEQAEFYKLFGAITIKHPTNRSAQINAIQNYYKKNGITFNNQKLAMISVYLPTDVDEDYKVFIGHVGVLLQAKNGKYLFMEKLAFQKPYQAIQFDNKAQLKDYLTKSYQPYGNKTLPQPIIMENEHVMR